MALTQEQINVRDGFVRTKQDVKAINAILPAKADLVGGKVAPEQIPDTAIVEFCGNVANQAAMLAVKTADNKNPGPGDWVIRTDDAKVYILKTVPATVAANWQAMSYPANPAPDNFSYVDAYNAA